MHLFKNNNEAKSRKSRLLSVALSAALVLGSFSVLSMADTKSETAPANQVVENTAKVDVKTQRAAQVEPTPTPQSCGTNAYYRLSDEGVLNIFTMNSGKADITYTGWQNNTSIKNVVISLLDGNELSLLSNMGTFNGCTSLKTVTVGISSSSSRPYTKIVFGSYCFRDCSALTKMDITSSMVSFGDSCFEPTFGNDPLKVDAYVHGLDPNGFSIQPDTTQQSYSDITFHFDDAVTAENYSHNYPIVGMYGNYVCDNGGPTNIPTPIPVGASFSVATNNSKFALVLKLKETSDWHYGPYTVTIDDAVYPNYEDVNNVIKIPENGEFYLPCDAKDINGKHEIKVESNYHGEYTLLYDGSLSVADFLNAVINDTESYNEIRREQAKAMLDYCSAAQKYFNASTPIEDLPNDGDFGRLDESTFPTATYDGLSLARALHLDKSVYAGITLRFNAKLDFYMFFKVKDGFTATQAEAELNERFPQTEQIGFITNDESGYVVMHGSSSDVNATLISFNINSETQSVAIKDYIVKVLEQTDPAYENLQRLCKALYLLMTVDVGQ